MRTRSVAHPNITFVRARCGQCIMLVWLLCAVGLACLPGLALADAPGTRGPGTAGQGSVGAGPRTRSSVTTPAWSDVQELPLPSMRAPAAAPALVPQQGGPESGPITWLGRNLNPGNWILDAGMGIFAGIIKM